MDHHNSDYQRLYDAVLQLHDTKECEMFFEDLFTIAELNAVSQRLKVASMLRDKKTCQVIAGETGASTATISRVNKCLNYGTGGYKMILERLEEK